MILKLIVFNVLKQILLKHCLIISRRLVLLGMYFEKQTVKVSRLGKPQSISKAYKKVLK